jgi:colanic acid biosynthesis protein WcaH
MKVDRSILLEVVRNTPLVSIDLIVRNQNRDVLLGLRANHPARDTWFVPGGRIVKNERIADAFERIARTELDAPLFLKHARFLGIFEHFYEENFAEVQGFGTHYVVLAYEVSAQISTPKSPSRQHKQMRWWNPYEILHSSEVHKYTRAYFI